MPTYTYVCESCGHREDRFLSLKDHLEFIACEECGETAQQVVNCENGFQLSGTGWARDKYTGSSNRRWLKGGEDD